MRNLAPIYFEFNLNHNSYATWSETNRPHLSNAVQTIFFQCQLLGVPGVRLKVKISTCVAPPAQCQLHAQENIKNTDNPGICDGEHSSAQGWTARWHP